MVRQTWSKRAGQVRRLDSSHRQCIVSVWGDRGYVQPQVKEQRRGPSFAGTTQTPLGDAESLDLYLKTRDSVTWTASVGTPHWMNPLSAQAQRGCSRYGNSRDVGWGHWYITSRLQGILTLQCKGSSDIPAKGQGQG